MGHMRERGFALPTVLIVSVVMFTILTVAASAVTGTSRTMHDQFYNQLAREATESGMRHAQECLEQNDYVAQWNDGSPLRPGSGCGGEPNALCVTNGTCLLSQNGLIKISYTVGSTSPGIGGAGQAIQLVDVKSTVTLNRATGGGVAREYSAALKGLAGGSLGINSVSHGYYRTSALVPQAFFIVKMSDGRLRSVGGNSYGQLSTGSTTPTSTVDVAYQGLPEGVEVDKVYTQFKSVDFNTFIQMGDGRLFAAGRNDVGQLGLGHTTNPIVTAQQYPPQGAFNRAIDANAGVNRSFVILATASPTVSTWTANVYTQGACTNSLGMGSTTCTGNQTTPARVALPTSVATDPNTKPKKVVFDGGLGLVLMEGGAVYGFGGIPCSTIRNLAGQTLGATPIRLSTPTTYFGNSGMNAVDIDTDGGTAYIRLSDGRLYSAGCGESGQLGSKRSRIKNHVSLSGGAEACMDIRGGGTANETPVQIYSCSSDVFNTAQAWTLTEDGHIYNESRNKCLDIRYGTMTAGTLLWLWDCNSTANAQRFFMDTDGRLRVASNTGLCVEMQAGGPTLTSGSQLYLWGCNSSSTWQRWTIRQQELFEQVYTPDNNTTTYSGNGRVLQNATDRGWVSFLVDTDNNGVGNNVYSVGMNYGGQHGDGTTSSIEPFPSRFLLPGGVVAQSLSLSATDPQVALSNMLVVGSDTKVYGAGDNQYGQLGRGMTSTYIATPLPMRANSANDLINIKTASIGGGTSILTSIDNRLYGVGNNNVGQLGDETTINRLYPVANSFVNRAQIISY